MKKNPVQFIKVLGIPIELDPSWFLVFALFTFALAAGYFPAEFHNWSKIQYWSVAAITALLFFASVIFHELAHSVVARKYKLSVRSITLYIFGGSSEITSEPPSPLSEFVISLTGPLSSLALAAFFYGMQFLFTDIPTIYAIAKYLALINGILAVFNLIPGFPLDGGRVLRAILWGLTHNLKRATEIASLLGYGIAFVFILVGVLRLFQGDWTNGLWISFTGWFLEVAVVGQVQQQRINLLLAGHTVEQVMSRDCMLVSGDLTIQELVDQYFIEKGKRCMIITHNGQPIGFFTLHNVRQVPREQREIITALEVMTPIDQTIVTSPKTELAHALARMGSDGVNQMPVIENGHVAGLISREDITSYLHLLQKLER